MRRPVFLLLLILLQITLPVKLSGQKPDYRLFDNISLGTEASVINCFLQDTQGLIWIGSNKGLFSYDGYSTQPHFTFAKRNNTQIYCGTVVDSTYLYLGADNGLLIYNYRTDTYEEPETQLPTDIRALLVHDGMLWLGTLNGLYTYSLNDHQLSAVTEGIPHQTIYSLIRSSDGLLYIGTYNGFCRYIPATRHFEEIAGFFSHIDYCMVGIGAYKPRWFMKPNHISPYDALTASADLHAKVTIPMHYGTFDLSDEPLFDPPHVFAAEAKKRGMPVIIPELGEIIKLQPIR